MQRPVTTSVGEMKRRDAVYLHSLSQSAGTLRFAGKLNGKLCSRTMDEWIDYELTFHGVSAYECRSVADCPWHLESGFDEIDAGDEVAAGGERWRYLLATDDFVYRIAAARFEFDEVGAQPFSYRPPIAAARYVRRPAARRASASLPR